MGAQGSVLDQLDSYVPSVRAEFERMLGELVEIPTISADPGHQDDILRGADLARQYLQAFGASAEVVDTPGNPVVLGKFLGGAGSPTITVYNHLDVQPAEEPEWTRNPFSFSAEGGRYEGRGCTDDKGPALTALFAARYAVEQGLPLNIQFIWELEEEIGSPNFEHFVRAGESSCKAIRCWCQTPYGSPAIPPPSRTRCEASRGRG